MSTDTAPVLTVTPAAAVRRGFGNLPCPRCQEDASIQLDLDDLALCTCRECGEEIALDTIRAILGAWGPVLAWIDSAPKLDV